MNKTIIKRLRLNDDEWQIISDELKDRRITFSKFALQSMINVAKRKRANKKQNPQNRDLIVELAKWGNNLNQVAKYLNIHKRGLDRVGIEMLSKIEEHLQEIRLKNGG